VSDTPDAQGMWPVPCHCGSRECQTYYTTHPRYARASVVTGVRYAPHTTHTTTPPTLPTMTEAVWAVVHGHLPWVVAGWPHASVGVRPVHGEATYHRAVVRACASLLARMGRL